jgi:Mrp family chromosome partitioning ATPase
LAASPSEPQESLRATHAGEAAAAEVFTAAWEADELPWSEVCDQLRDASGPELLAAIARWRSTLSGGTAPNAGAAVNSGADDAREWPAPLVLGVTSLIRREGRTTVVAGLARAAVAAGLRVALLDADLENPRLSAAAEVAIDATWVDCVVGDAPLSEAAIRCSADGFHLFPLGVAAKQSTFHWNAPSGLRMFRSLRRHFDLCLLDMGPLTDALKRGLQGGADSPLDGVLLLRDVRITGADQVLLIARELHQAGLPIVGVVDNFNDISEQSRCMKATGS